MIAELISIQANLGDVIDKAIIKDGYNLVVVNWKRPAWYVHLLLVVPYFNLRVFLKCPDGTSVRGKGFFNCVCSSTEKTRIQNADPNAVKFLTTNYVVLDFDLNDKKKKWTIGRPGLIKRHAPLDQERDSTHYGT